MKTSELTGNELDRWVALALGWHEEGDFWYGPTEITGRVTRDDNPVQAEVERFHPSRSWAQGGPIIDREQMTITSPGSRVHRNGGPNAGWGPSGIWGACTWHAGANGRRSIAHHETSPLIAAMRAYVASKFGDEVADERP